MNRPSREAWLERRRLWSTLYLALHRHHHGLVSKLLPDPQIQFYCHQSKPKNRREARLHEAMCRAVWLPIDLFIYSVTQYEDQFSFGPIIGLALIDIGIFFISETCYSYTSDCDGENSSSAIAVRGSYETPLARCRRPSRRSISSTCAASMLGFSGSHRLC